MRWRSGAAILTALLFAVSSMSWPQSQVAPVFAAGVLDQQQTSAAVIFPVGGGIGHAAQTFTAGASGALDQVDLNLSNPSISAETYTFEIRDVVGGVYGDTVLGSFDVDATAIDFTSAWRTFTISPPVPVVSGTQYAIVQPGGGTLMLMWFFAVGDPYAAGGLVLSPDGGVTRSPIVGGDFAFRTYVTPPATATPTATSTATATPTPTVTVTPTATVPVTTTATVPVTITATVPAASSTPSPTATTTATAIVVATVTQTPTVIAQASGPGDDDTDKDSGRNKSREQRQQEQNTNNGNRDDVYTEGNVLEVGQDAQGAFAVIGMRDGVMVVRLNCQGECPTVMPGDYIQVDGVKENEGLFYADEVDVSR